MPRAKIAATLPADDIIARVRDTANWTGGAQQARYQVAGVQPVTASPTLAYAPADREADPYAGFETRIVPENITLLPKTGSQVTGGNSWNERAVTVKKGDTITTILRELGATPDEIKAIAAALGTRGRDGGLKEGQRLRILVASVAGSQTPAAGPRHRHRRKCDRSRGCAVRSRPLRPVDVDQHEHRGRRRRR